MTGPVLNYSNCSLYFLPHGHMQLYDSLNELILSGNVSIRNPALYITNCSADYNDVYNYFVEYLTENGVDGFITSQSIDSFKGSMVLILFAFSAIVVSSWMLLLVLYLSSHKKPISIEIATLIYSVSVSVILDRVTKLLASDSVLDVQDVHHFEQTILNGYYYLILLLISQLATWIAWLDIVIYIMPVNYQKKAGKVGLVMIIVNTLMVGLNSFYLRVKHISGETQEPISTITVVSQLLIQVCFCVSVISYTIRNRDLAYNIHTLPLVAITLPIMSTPIVFYLISNYCQPLKSWSRVFYSFGQIVSCALVWEWIFDIEMTSKEIELNGIVGREIDHSISRGAGNTAWFNFFNLRQRRRDGRISRTNEDEGYELNNISISSADDYYDNAVADSILDRNSQMATTISSIESNLSQDNNRMSNNNELYESLQPASSNIHNGEDEVAQRLTAPPDFEPHPNFNTGDYWLEEKSHTRRDN